MDALDDIDIVNYFDIDDENEADDDFVHLAELVAFPRRAKVIRERPDHFNVWSDEEFLNRFRLKKDTIKFILRLIEQTIKSQ